MASTTPREASFSGRVTKDVGLRYLLWEPAAPQGEVPLVLFLHGSGERGDDLSLVLREGLPAAAALAQPELPFFVAAPQCPLASDWELQADALLALLDDLCARLPVDRSRVYLTGLSMGGRGAWNLAALAPGRFAALAPVCGRRPNWLRMPERLALLRDVPTWIFHGARDQVVPLEESEAMAAALAVVGADVRLTIYPEAEHDSWTQAYAEPGLLPWLLARRRAG